MRRAVLILTLVLLPLAHSAAQKMYRWVDERGKVHYSERKPPASVGAGAADAKQLTRPGVERTELRKTDRGEFCGDTMLIGTRKWPERTLASLPDMREKWRRKLRRARKDYTRLSNASRANFRTAERLERHTNRLKDVREEIATAHCALAWTDQKAQELAGIGDRLEHETSLLAAEVSELEQRIERDCGPMLEWIVPSNKDHLEWSLCSKAMRNQLTIKRKAHKRLESRLRWMDRKF